MTAPTDTDMIPKGFYLSLTDSAARQVGIALKQNGLPEAAGLRVGVTEGGCSGMNYDVRVVEGPEDGDVTYVLNGVNVFVRPADAAYIGGMKIDWISSMQESRFVFENPNATGGCGCGVSFTVA
ncbi:MAG: iron-sulfur cluster assembly accessory protein [Gemmatimonadota bacterium]|nr:iron-sulfur cluster assembly accessory protein [Gemmatimonadota bacterium]